MKNIEKIIEKEKEIHVNGLSSLEIFAPDANEKYFEKFIVVCGENEFLKYGWCKFPWKNVPKEVYKKLIINFEREKGDLSFSSNPDVIYMLVTSLLEPQMKKSYKFKYAGFITVSEDIIQIAWIHPFLRNKNTLTSFLIFYAENENCINIQPPLSKSMQKCLNKVQDIIVNDDKLNKKHNEFRKSYLIKKLPFLTEYNITYDELDFIASSLMFYNMKKEEVKNFSLEEIVLSCLKAKRFLDIHPDKEKIISEFKNVDLSEFKNKIKEYINFG